MVVGPSSQYSCAHVPLRDVSRIQYATSLSLGVSPRAASLPARSACHAVLAVKSARTDAPPGRGRPALALDGKNGAAGGTRRQSAGALGIIVMKAIDRLSDRHVLALGKFIVGCVRVRQSRNWRSQLATCARNNTFVPFVEMRENEVLRDLFKRHPQGWVCGVPTSQVLLAANEVAREWGEPPLELEAPSCAQTEVTSG